MRPFEPKDVIEAYRRHGLTPSFMFNVVIRDGKLAALSSRCCALSVMCLGDRASSVPQAANDKWPGFSAWSFVQGFDGGPPDQEIVNSNERGEGPGFDRESYDLGRECRELALREFP